MIVSFDQQRTTIIHFMRHEGRICFRKLPDELWSVSARGETESQPVKISETVETAQNLQAESQITVSEEVKSEPVKSKPSKSFAIGNEVASLAFGGHGRLPASFD